jgi:hypothetical protein
MEGSYPCAGRDKWQKVEDVRDEATLGNYVFPVVFRHLFFVGCGQV